MLAPSYIVAPCLRYYHNVAKHRTSTVRIIHLVCTRNTQAPPRSTRMHRPCATQEPAAGYLPVRALSSLTILNNNNNNNKCSTGLIARDNPSSSNRISTAAVGRAISHQRSHWVVCTLVAVGTHHKPTYNQSATLQPCKTISYSRATSGLWPHSEC